MKPYWIVLFILILLPGCMEHSGVLAPVEERKWHPINMHASRHHVQKGETLYAVAFRYDKDYQQLAALNHLKKPYAIRVGQVLILTGKQKHHPTKRQFSSALPMHRVLALPKQQVFAHKQEHAWYWPCAGKIVSSFFPEKGKKGIDIAGKKGDVVRASKEGVVAYSGAGLSGYGNLIIIKHAGQFLTAYGNNARNRVSEGQQVKAGQIIADMGIVDRQFWGVHFEIRKSGKPVNPRAYLN